jgi:hypothetical protein
MIQLTLDALVAFMRKNKFEADIQHDTKQVYSILKVQNREYPLFLRIFESSHLLQVIVFIPSHLTPLSPSDTKEKEHIFGDVARFLHLVNKELDVPGFGMDENAGVVFYRLMLPSTHKRVDEDVLIAYIKTAQHVCQMFSGAIEGISSGQMTLKQVLEKAKESTSS